MQLEHDMLFMIDLLLIRELFLLNSLLLMLMFDERYYKFSSVAFEVDIQ